MDLNALLGDNKGSINKLLGGLNLSSNEMDKTIDSTKAVVSDQLLKETKKNGLATALNLFSGDDNSAESNSLIENTSNNLVKKLVSNGISKQKAGSIKELILPFVIKLVASKVGGNSKMLTSLLGGLSSGNTKGSGGLLGKLFN